MNYNDISGENMKKIIIFKLMVLIINVVFISTFFSTSATSNTIIVTEDRINNDHILITYNFEEPIIEEIKIGNEYFNKLVSKGAIYTGEPGQPALPSKAVKLLIPYKTKVKNIEIISDKKESISNGIKIQILL